ncbi:LysM peptidoglycan-binding domain-containing protein [Neptuniibacter sp. CAU 1671]|uniref:LysM peptidoglycan-binding domain-containing protein n=1 Tax=Neptuniibacter sp. CAU 1671 TaxID=3032593 RepID=UPI0023DBE6C4|nr:LysM peptidoglycan-binding domain-containing protein [Neptuniibacter sp. CAU 1671]MDF2180845.1 LysM peptidoglycan-binding domain-containing protein [Neptuniibacter sp. CAU 1671]
MVLQPEQTTDASHPAEIDPETSQVIATRPNIKKASQQPTATLPQEETTSDLWQLTRARLNLDPSLEQSRVQQQLNWYRKHPQYMHRTLSRAAPYYHYILEQTAARGLPAELALLPIVESAYDPFAYSHGRAAGAWQFIPSTAEHFGLKKTWWYDGRRDILESTDAALNYLEQLNQRFEGDWLLALAAYNAGGGTVSRAIRKNSEKGLPTDFWSLKLPKETQKYVPKLLAVAELLRHHEQYDLTLPELPNQAYFEVVETESQIDLAWAAKLVDMELDDLYRLNPGFNRWATDPSGPHRLLIPVEKSALLKAGLAETPPEKRLKWQRYTIRSGDSLLSIAKRFNTTVDVLRTSNNLTGSRIRAGKTLLIPSASEQPEAYVLSQVQRQQSRQNSVKASAARTHYHTVQSGDNLWQLARTYNVDVKSLARWNSMAPGDTLKLGTKLIIVADNSSQSSASDLRAKSRKIGYQVRSGDSLHKIAGRYNVAVNDILRWNKLSGSEYLQPGQQLTLYIDVRKAR